MGYKQTGGWNLQSERKEVEQYLENHPNVADHIDFLGIIEGEDKEVLLLQSDIFVFPTYYRYEGQPAVVVEAMAAGLPIITTDQGGIRDMVIHGENGFFVEAQNPGSIAETALMLIENRKLRDQMRNTNRKRFKKDYTAETCFKSLCEALDRVSNP